MMPIKRMRVKKTFEFEWDVWPWGNFESGAVTVNVTKFVKKWKKRMDEIVDLNSAGFFTICYDMRDGER